MVDDCNTTIMEVFEQTKVQNAFSSLLCTGIAVCIRFPGFSRSEACAVLWGIFVRGLHVKTFVRVLRSSRVNFK